MKEYGAIVIGSGAAGYNAANRIKESGVLSVAMVTENVFWGTSRNTGSDKQTYYKLNIAGETRDSVRQMVQDLFAPGCVDGDNALCEAALSVRSFMNLCELGVAFPTNRYGEYIGYKTDHDPYARATSAGPLTSKYMTEALQKRADELNVEVLDGCLALEILKDNNGVVGLFCLDMKTSEFFGIKCANIILATGGPAGIYADSVYPTSHSGSTSLALSANAKMQNLTEWQYGLASTSPRWNVSGTYMQVLPRFVSVDEDGTEHEFLSDYFEDMYTALSTVFLKGYQWPFDSKKVLEGSSVIDLLVYKERVIKKRRVYLDFTKNPFSLNEIDFNKLSPEAFEYLSKAECLFGTPIDRLLKMNTPAVELYLSKGVDLTREYLEIALCAQHNNGGIAVDKWWQTSVSGLFAAGECAGTHGIARPGGSALNAGQVGSLRAAQYICAHPRKDGDFDTAYTNALKRYTCESEKVLENAAESVDTLILNAQRKMSDCAAAIRNCESMEKYKSEIISLVANLSDKVSVKNKKDLYKFYKLRDILLVQWAVTESMLQFAREWDKTRGSALYYSEKGSLRDGLDEIFRFSGENGETKDYIQETEFNGKEMVCVNRKVRPIPDEGDFFENVWRSYRENKNIF